VEVLDEDNIDFELDVMGGDCDGILYVLQLAVVAVVVVPVAAAAPPVAKEEDGVGGVFSL